MSIDGSPGPSSLNTPLPSTHHLKPCPNPDLWEYNSEELVRFVPMRKLSRSTNTSAVWPHFKVHTSKEKEYADKAWCDYCHKPFAREHSTLFRHIERNHKDQLKKEDSVVCSKNEKTILTAKKSQLEHISNPASHMKLLAHAWCEIADSLTFSEFVACISRGSFKMPGRTKVTKMIDELYVDMMLQLKDMLKQSSSVSLTTDAAKMIHMLPSQATGSVQVGNCCQLCWP